MQISEIEQKVEKNLFFFLDNWIWIGCDKFGLLQRKYLSSGVNVLANNLKILHITNRDIFKLNFPQSDEKFDKSAVMQTSQMCRNL